MKDWARKAERERVGEKACTRNKLDLTTVRHATHTQVQWTKGREEAQQKRMIK